MHAVELIRGKPRALSHSEAGLPVDKDLNEDNREQMPAEVPHPAEESRVAIFQNDPVSKPKCLLSSIDQWPRLFDFEYNLKS